MNKTYVDWEIAACIEMLTEQAYNYALTINEGRRERGLAPAKDAHEKCIAWNAAAIIRQLQKELAENVEQKTALSKQMNEILANAKAASEIKIIIPDKSIPKTRRKKA